MFLFFQAMPEYLTFANIAAVAAAVILLATTIKAIKDIRSEGWEPFKAKWITPRKARIARQDVMMAKVETMSSKLDEVVREVKPNGGSSLKDLVCSIDCKLENVIAERRHQKETSDEAIFHLDGLGEMVYANCTFRELINAEDGQLEHHNYLSLMDDDDRSRFVRLRQEAIDYKMPLDAIVKFKLHGPHMIKVRLQGSPDVRHGGMLKGFFGSAYEIKPDA